MRPLSQAKQTVHGVYEREMGNGKWRVAIFDEILILTAIAELHQKCIREKYQVGCLFCKHVRSINWSIPSKKSEVVFISKMWTGSSL